MITSIDREKALHIPHPFISKPLQKLGIENFNMIKGIYENPTVTLTVKDWTRQECLPLLTVSTQQSTRSFSQSNLARKWNRGHPNWEGRKATFIHRWHDLIYGKSQRIQRKTARANKFGQVAGHKSMHNNQYTSKWKRKLRAIPLTNASKNVKYLGII